MEDVSSRNTDRVPGGGGGSVRVLIDHGFDASHLESVEHVFMEIGGGGGGGLRDLQVVGAQVGRNGYVGDPPYVRLNAAACAPGSHREGAVYCMLGAPGTRPTRVKSPSGSGPSASHSRKQCHVHAVATCPAFDDDERRVNTFVGRFATPQHTTVYTTELPLLLRQGNK